MKKASDFLWRTVAVQDSETVVAKCHDGTRVPSGWRVFLFSNQFNEGVIYVKRRVVCLTIILLLLMLVFCQAAFAASATTGILNGAAQWAQDIIHPLQKAAMSISVICLVAAALVEMLLSIISPDHRGSPLKNVLLSIAALCLIFGVVAPYVFSRF
jgi:hypothetical protein